MASVASFSVIKTPFNIRHIPVASKDVLDSNDNLYLVNRVYNTTSRLNYVKVTKFSALFKTEWELVVGAGGYYNHTACHAKLNPQGSFLFISGVTNSTGPALNSANTAKLKIFVLKITPTGTLELSYAFDSNNNPTFNLVSNGALAVGSTHIFVNQIAKDFADSTGFRGHSHIIRLDYDLVEYQPLHTRRQRI